MEQMSADKPATGVSIAFLFHKLRMKAIFGSAPKLFVLITFFFLYSSCHHLRSNSILIASSTFFYDSLYDSAHFHYY